MTKVDEAAALEAEAQEYPDERGEILLEAAVAWREAGRPERARELLGQLIAGGGEDRCYARFQLADDYFADGADEKAYAELALLSREPALHDGHCEMAADLLAERGDLPGALRWYDRTVARLTPETLDELRDSDSWLQSSSIMLRNRRDVRRRLGLTPDAMDEVTPDAPLGPLMDFDDIRDRAAASRPPVKYGCWCSSAVSAPRPVAVGRTSPPSRTRSTTRRLSGGGVSCPTAACLPFGWFPSTLPPCAISPTVRDSRRRTMRLERPMHRRSPRNA